MPVNTWNRIRTYTPILVNKPANTAVIVVGAVG